MTQWYVKDLSKLTGVSVQTLHHYDRIGLLEPSVRLPNGYRIYSEQDLLRLQQIIALKYFGFELAQIKELLSDEMNIRDHFAGQSQYLEDKAKSLVNASNALKALLSDCHHDESIPWQTIIKLIGVYRMTQKLEKTWAGKALNQQELKDYVDFEQELQTRFSAAEKVESEKQWDAIVQAVNENMAQDPASDTGMKIGKRCMDWVNVIYGKKYAALKKAVWDKGFKSGQAGSEHNLSPAAITWLDQAISAYYRKRIMDILSLSVNNPDEAINAWSELMMEMCGDEQSMRDDIIAKVLGLDVVKQDAKDWLIRNFK